MATSNGRRSYNWGRIIPVSLVLIGATWQLAVTATDIRRDLEDIKSGVDAVKANVEKLQVAVAGAPMEPKAEDETLAELRSAFENLREEVLQAATTALERETTALEGDRSGDPPTPFSLGEFCDGSEMPSELDIILVGQAVEGTLSETDQQLEDETYFDAWVLPICEPGTITVEMKSEVMDSYILMSSLSTWEYVGEDDDGGDELNARLTTDVEAGLYLIAANTSAIFIFGERTGDYTLSVQR